MPMHRVYTLLFLTALVSFLTGCSTPNVRRSAVYGTTVVGGAAAGAAIAGKGKEVQGAAIGALGGLLIGGGVNHVMDKETAEAYVDGYEKGRSDTAKTLYWASKSLNTPADEQGLKTKLYEMPVPEHVTSDGTIIRPSTVVVEIPTP